MTAAYVASSSEELAGHIEGWDRLAVNAASPLMRPGWLMSWWHGYREQAPGAELRVALAVNEDRLVGVLPMFARDGPGRLAVYGPLGAGSFWGFRPLIDHAAPEALAVLVEALAASLPAAAAVELPAVDAAAGWVDETRRLWGAKGASAYVRVAENPCHLVEMGGGVDAWLRGSGRRSEYHRQLRRLHERGAILRASATVAEFGHDLAQLVRLHHQRWANDSQWLRPHVETALPLAGEALMDVGGVRLWVLEANDGVIGATLFAAAGSESCNLVTAYDRDWASQAPGIVTIIAGIEDAAERGAVRVDLGHGGFPYKLELANAVRPVSWQRLYPRGRTYARARLSWAPLEAQERLHRVRVQLRLRQRVRAVLGK